MRRRHRMDQKTTPPIGRCGPCVKDNAGAGGKSRNQEQEFPHALSGRWFTASACPAVFLRLSSSPMLGVGSVIGRRAELVLIPSGHGRMRIVSPHEVSVGEV